MRAHLYITVIVVPNARQLVYGGTRYYSDRDSQSSRSKTPITEFILVRAERAFLQTGAGDKIVLGDGIAQSHRQAELVASGTLAKFQSLMRQCG